MAKPILEAYLALEKRMLQLDAESDSAAEHIRDAMDPLWDELGESDHEFLGSRGFVESPSPGATISVLDACSDIAPVNAEGRAVRRGLEYTDEIEIPLDDVIAA